MAVKGDVNGVLPSGEIWGWVLDTEAPDVTQRVRIDIAGQTFELEADLPRPDIAAVAEGHTSHGFVFAPPLDLPPGQYSVEIHSLASGKLLPRGRLELIIPERQDGRIRFRVVSFTPRRITGWVYDQEEPEACLSIAVAVDGLQVQTVVSNIPRKDVEGHHGVKRRAGFHTALPLEFWNGDTHRVTLIETRTGSVIQDGLLTTSDTRLADRAGLLRGELLDYAGAEVSGWVAGGATPLTVELELDRIVIDRKEAGEPVLLDLRRRAGFGFTALPAAFFDGAEHHIAAYALSGGERVLIGERYRVLAPSEAPRLEGELRPARAGRLGGRAVHPTRPEEPIELSLMVDGAEVQSLITRTADGAGGSFEFTLPAAPGGDNWLAAQIAVMDLKLGLTLPYAGAHPARDSLKASLGAGPNGGDTLSVTAGVPLPSRLEAELVAPDGTAQRSIELVTLADGFTAAATLAPGDAAALSADLQLRVHSVLLRLSARAKQERPQPAPQGSTGRQPRHLLPPLDPRVRRRLSDLLRGGATPEGETRQPDYSGVWRFRPPATIEGWALDLANPADPLEVELLADGRPVQRGFAHQVTRPREAGLDAELPLGFRFGLETLGLGQASAAFEVRVVGGGGLVPQTAKRIDLTALQRGTGGIEQIDALVAEGRLAEAYLRARALARGGSAAQLHRLLALDVLLRTSWHDYDAFLDQWSGRAEQSFLASLRDGSRRRDLADGSIDSDLPRKGDLPQAVYGPHFEAIAAAGWPAPVRGTFEAAALWSSLAQLPVDGDPQPRHGDLAIVLTQPPAPASRHALDHIASLGGLILEILPDERAEELAARLEAAAGERRCFVVLHETRLLPIAASGYWPALLASGGATPGTAVDLGSAPLSQLRCSLLGRFEDSAVALCATAQQAAGLALGALPDDTAATAEFLVGHSIPEGLEAPVCVVLHDLPEGRAPTLPAGALVQAVIPADEDDGLAAAWAVIASQDLPPATPVFLLSRAFEYPADHVARLLREHHRCGHRSVVTHRLTYLPESGEFRLGNSAGLSEVYLGLRAQGCYRLSDLRASTAQGVPELDDRVVLATEQPFHLAATDGAALGGTALDVAALLPAVRALNGSLAAQDKGFTGATLASWAGACEALGMPPAALSDEDQALLRAASWEDPQRWTEEADFYRRLDALARRGHHELAASALRSLIESRAGVLRLDDDSLLGLLECCKTLGLQHHFNLHLHQQLPELLARSRRLIMPLSENMATSLALDEIVAILIAGAALVLQGTDGRAVRRIIAACKRYCPAPVMATLVGMLQRSRHAELLKEAATAEVIGDALTGSQPAYRAVTDSTGTLLDTDFAASLQTRVNAALLAGDGPLFATLVNRYCRQQLSLAQLILKLRVYSYEITQLGIATGTIHYPTHATLKENIALAILMDDGQAERCLGSLTAAEHDTTDDPQRIVAATYRRNMRPLDCAFERLARECGVMPLQFTGESIEAMFAGFASQPLPPAAQARHGKVSIILTVYNPDMTLLARALDSLVRQTYQDIEILLVDDASDLVDGDAIAALAQQDPRITFLRMPRNVGPYVGRNRALEVASGDFVAIHDGDDYAHPQRIEKQVAALAQSPVLQLATTGHLRIDRLARLQFEHTLEIVGDGTMTSMFRRTVFEAIGGFAPVRSRGDVEFRERLRGAYGGHVHVHLPCPLTFCFATPGSLSNSVSGLLPDYLALFREAFAKRLRVPVLQGRRIAADQDPLVIPWPLRSENRLP